MAKKPNTDSQTAGQQKPLTVSDERMDVVMRHVNRGLSKAHVNTLETIIAARLVAVSGAAQVATDNPQANRMELIDGIVADLRQALTRRLMPELMVAQNGEA